MVVENEPKYFPIFAATWDRTGWVTPLLYGSRYRHASVLYDPCLGHATIHISVYVYKLISYILNVNMHGECPHITRVGTDFVSAQTQTSSLLWPRT